MPVLRRIPGFSTHYEAKEGATQTPSIKNPQHNYTKPKPCIQGKKPEITDRNSVPIKAHSIAPAALEVIEESSVIIDILL